MFSFLHAVLSFSKREYELETPIHVLLADNRIEENPNFRSKLKLHYLSAGDGDDNRSREKRENSLSSLGCTPHQVLGGGQL